MAEVCFSILKNLLMFSIVCTFLVWALDCNFKHLRAYATHFYAIRDRHPRYRQLFRFISVLAGYCVLGMLTYFAMLVLSDLGTISPWWLLVAFVVLVLAAIPIGAIAAVVLLKRCDGDGDDAEFERLDREVTNELRIRLGRKPRPLPSSAE